MKFLCREKCQNATTPIQQNDTSHQQSIHAVKDTPIPTTTIAPIDPLPCAPIARWMLSSVSDLIR